MGSHASDDVLPGDGPTFRRAEKRKNRALREEVADLRRLIEDYRAATDATRRETQVWIQEGFETLKKHPSSALQHPSTELEHSHSSSTHKSAVVAPDVFTTTSTAKASMKWTNSPPERHHPSSPQKRKPTTIPRSQEIAIANSAYRAEGTAKLPQRHIRRENKKKKRMWQRRRDTAKLNEDNESARGKISMHGREKTMNQDAPLGTVSAFQQSIEISVLPEKVSPRPSNVPSQATKIPEESRSVSARTTLSKMNVSPPAQGLPATNQVKAAASATTASRQFLAPTAPAARVSWHKYSQMRNKVPQTRGWNTASHYREISMPLKDANTAQCTCSELPVHFLKAGPSGPEFRTWTGGIAEYLCHCKQIMNCRGHSDIMKTTCREFYGSEWPRFEARLVLSGQCRKFTNIRLGLSQHPCKGSGCPASKNQGQHERCRVGSNHWRGSCFPRRS